MVPLPLPLPSSGADSEGLAMMYVVDVQDFGFVCSPVGLVPSEYRREQGGFLSASEERTRQMLRLDRGGYAVCLSTNSPGFGLM